jgi:hypothetical protein
MKVENGNKVWMKQNVDENKVWMREDEMNNEAPSSFCVSRTHINKKTRHNGFLVRT